MKLVESFNDYSIEMIIESVKNDTSILVLSNELAEILQMIKHPIAERLLNCYYDMSYRDDNYKVTLIDIVDNELDKVTFMQSNKAIEIVAKQLNIELSREYPLTDENKQLIYREISFNSSKYFSMSNRPITSIGRIIKKLFPDVKESGDVGNDIESFVNSFKSIQDKNENFEIVSGDEIIYWYNEKNYSPTARNTPLGFGCMRYDKCGEYLEFFAENSDKVNLLILKDPNDNSKIIGKSLLWNLDVPSDRIFMDKVYCTNPHIIDMFVDYAKENNFLYKKVQNVDNNEDIIDPESSEIVKNMIVYDMKDTEFYPYLDTLKYYNHKDLSNHFENIEGTLNKDIIKLEDSDGGITLSNKFDYEHERI